MCIGFINQKTPLRKSQGLHVVTKIAKQNMNPAMRYLKAAMRQSTYQTRNKTVRRAENSARYKNL